MCGSLYLAVRARSRTTSIGFSPIRSSSFTIRKIPITFRKSLATGWRRAMISTALSSMVRCRTSILVSASITRNARSLSRVFRASITSVTCFSASPPISPSVSARPCSSESNVKTSGQSGRCRRPGQQSAQSKSNMSNRSPTAGMFLGTYGWSGSMCGLGRLSRLRPVSGFKCQFRSMNFTTDAWSL